VNFLRCFNVEYTFPIFGELQGAVFTDAGNLLPTSEEPGLDDMRYAIGAGLRYKITGRPDSTWTTESIPTRTLKKISARSISASALLFDFRMLEASSRPPG
jgi:hypothetical protein